MLRDDDFFTVFLRQHRCVAQRGEPIVNEVEGLVRGADELAAELDHFERRLLDGVAFDAHHLPQRRAQRRDHFQCAGRGVSVFGAILHRDLFSKVTTHH